MWELLKDYGYVLVGFAAYFAGQIRTEARYGVRIENLEKESRVIRLEQDFKDHKEAQKEHDLTLWHKIDDMGSKVNDILQSMVRVETILKITKE